MENLYTITVEYRGGTYVSQVKATGPQEALLSWANARGPRKRGELGANVRLEVLKQLQDENGPVALKGCKNVWCQSGVLRDELILIHVVCTCA